MKKVITAIFLISLGASVNAFAGCQHSYDHASDGSICGGRSADSRPGGK